MSYGSVTKEDIFNVKSVIERLYTNGIDAIRSLSRKDGKIAGVFRDGAKLLEFSIDPNSEDPAEQISYKIINPEVLPRNDEARSDAEAIEVEGEPLSDDDFDELAEVSESDVLAVLEGIVE